MGRIVLQDKSRGFTVTVYPNEPDLACYCIWPGGRAKVYLFSWDAVCDPLPPKELVELLKTHLKDLLRGLEQGDS